MSAPRLLAFYGSPRRTGNTATLLKRAVAGARAAGAEVEEIVLRDLKISPCLEIYGCAKTGRCVIQDDFQDVYDRIVACDGLMLASPMMFYTVSGITKAMMDRCQSLWVKKFWIEKTPFGPRKKPKKGLFISVGATVGKRLFDGALLTVQYWMDPLDMDLWRSLTYRGIDFEGDIDKHPQHLVEAEAAGRELVETLKGE